MKIRTTLRSGRNIISVNMKNLVSFRHWQFVIAHIVYFNGGTFSLRKNAMIITFDGKSVGENAFISVFLTCIRQNRDSKYSHFAQETVLKCLMDKRKERSKDEQKVLL